MPTAAVLGVASVIGAVSSRNASKKSTKATTKAADTAAAETRRATTEARGDLHKIFPAAQQTGRQGFQGGLDIFGQSLPAQTDVFTQGNLGAQQAITQGLQQQQNALFGNQVDLSQLQPFQVQQPDLSFFQQQLPDAIDPFAPPTNEQMGFGGFLPPGQFTGPFKNPNDPTNPNGAQNPFGAQTPFSGLQGPMFGGTFGR